MHDDAKKIHSSPFFKSYSLTKNPWADVLSILSPGID